jgi:uncharacterized Fe-S radical SAM superfamily protein PflX
MDERLPKAGRKRHERVVPLEDSDHRRFLFGSQTLDAERPARRLPAQIEKAHTTRPATDSFNDLWHQFCSIQQTFHSIRGEPWVAPHRDLTHAAPIKTDVEPVYLTLFRSGELAGRAKRAAAHLACCGLCARYCRVDRYLGVKGAVCRTGVRAMVSSFAPHYGEERPLSGTRRSGTIFFTWCNLRCVFCQNYDIANWERATK